MCFKKDWYCMNHEVVHSTRTCYKLMKIDNEGKLHSPCFETDRSYSLGDTMYHSVRITDYDGMDRVEEFTYGVIHAFNNLDSAIRHLTSNCVIVKCILSKNTVYWENTNEIACMKLKLKEIYVKRKILRQ